MRITNTHMSITTTLSRMPETQRRMTRFLEKPCKRNLPPQLKAKVVSNGEVYPCDAPDGKKIMLKTKYRSEVITSMRYENGKVYAELRAESTGRRARERAEEQSEVFLIKEDNRIYYEGLKLRKYMKPECISKILSPQKNKIFHPIEDWLQDKADIPETVTKKTTHRGEFLLCSYNGEPFLLPLGFKFRNLPASGDCAEEEGSKRVTVTVILENQRLQWAFKLEPTEEKCSYKKLWGPIIL